MGLLAIQSAWLGEPLWPGNTMRPQQVENYQVPTGVIVIFYELDRTSQLSFIENLENLNNNTSVWLFYLIFESNSFTVVFLNRGSRVARDNVFNNLYIYSVLKSSQYFMRLFSPPPGFHRIFSTGDIRYSSTRQAWLD